MFFDNLKKVYYTLKNKEENMHKFIKRYNTSPILSIAEQAKIRYMEFFEKSSHSMATEIIIKRGLHESNLQQDLHKFLQISICADLGLSEVILFS